MATSGTGMQYVLFLVNDCMPSVCCTNTSFKRFSFVVCLFGFTYIGPKAWCHMIYRIFLFNCLVYKPRILGALQCKVKTLHPALCLEVHVRGVVVLPVLYTNVVVILLHMTEIATP